MKTWQSVALLLALAVAIYAIVLIALNTSEGDASGQPAPTVVEQTTTTTEPPTTTTTELGLDRFEFDGTWDVRAFCHKGTRFYIMNNSYEFEAVPNDPACVEVPQ